VGRYGTNLEGFGAFEGGVNADKGAPLVSTSSDGETALLFGPAALREIQAGLANGDFAIPPDEADATITAENPLPYWTFTDVNSAGAITCAIVNDPGAASTNVLRFTVNSGTLTGKSATLTRYIPVASSASRSFSFYAEATFDNGTNSTQSNAKITCQFYKSDQTTTTGTAFSSATVLFSDLITAEGLLAPDFYNDPTLLVDTTAPADAAYLKITITIATVATQSAARTVDLTEVRLGNGLPEILFTDRNNPTNSPGYILCADATMALGAPTDEGSLRLGDSTSLNASVEIILDSPSVKIFGANSEYVARVTATAAQSLTNNTVTKITFNTASATPDIDSYDPNGWFNNANDRIVIGQDGFYNISANVGFATNATSRRLVLIYVNGVQREGVQVTASSAGTTLLSISTNLYLVADDYVEVHALQQSGGALNTVISAGVTPFLSVGRIGA
jgi:hypothetical protein